MLQKQIYMRHFSARQPKGKLCLGVLKTRQMTPTPIINTTYIYGTGAPSPSILQHNATLLAGLKMKHQYYRMRCSLTNLVKSESRILNRRRYSISRSQAGAVARCRNRNRYSYNMRSRARLVRVVFLAVAQVSR